MKRKEMKGKERQGNLYCERLIKAVIVSLMAAFTLATVAVVALELISASKPNFAVY